MIYHVLDPTTPWFEFLSYQECCWSLNRPVRLGSFLRYNQYYAEINEEKNNKKNQGKTDR